MSENGDLVDVDLESQTEEPLKEVSRESMARGEDDDEAKKKEEEFSLWTKIWQGTAVATVALNLVSMILFTAVTTVIKGLVAMGVAGIVFWVQFQVEDTDCKYHNKRRGLPNVYDSRPSMDFSRHEYTLACCCCCC